MKSPFSFLHIVLFLAAGVFGVLATLQLSTLSQSLFHTARDGQSVNPLRAIKILVDTNTALRKELIAQKQEIEALKSESTRTDALKKQQETLKQAAGEGEVSGEGLRLSIDAPLTTSVFVDLLNTLYTEGISDLAINGVRMTERVRGIEKQGKGFLIGGVQVSAPYTFEILGDPVRLRHLLYISGGMIDQVQQMFPEAIISVKSVDLLILPRSV